MFDVNKDVRKLYFATTFKNVRLKSRKDSQSISLPISLLAIFLLSYYLKCSDRDSLDCQLKGLKDFFETQSYFLLLCKSVSNSNNNVIYCILFIENISNFS